MNGGPLSLGTPLVHTMVDLTNPQRIDGKGINGRPATKVYCGAVFVPKGYEYTRRYETASWYTILTTTEGGWYPVFATRHHIYDKWELTARVQATITSEFTPSSFGGVMYGSQPQGENHRNVGREDEFHLTVKPGMFESRLGYPKYFDEPRFMPVTLGFSAVRNFYTHSWPSEGGIHYSDSWEWRPYNDEHIAKLSPVPGLQVEKYGNVTIKEVA